MTPMFMVVGVPLGYVMGQDATRDPEETVKVRAYESDRERLNALKRGNDSQQDVIRRLLDEEEPDAVVKPELGFDPEVAAEAISQALGDADADVPADVREQLDRIEAAATTAEERTNKLENTLEGMQR